MNMVILQASFFQKIFYMKFKKSKLYKDKNYDEYFLFLKKGKHNLRECFWFLAYNGCLVRFYSPKDFLYEVC